ncbi:hypothetical protein FB451DRAFT_1195242 [Mycena latifolia]|nr:hypothetical protein FB451DRAFT_1195242 [Mycena latifolia]
MNAGQMKVGMKAGIDIGINGLIAAGRQADTSHGYPRLTLGSASARIPSDFRLLRRSTGKLLVNENPGLKITLNIFPHTHLAGLWHVTQAIPHQAKPILQCSSRLRYPVNSTRVLLVVITLTTGHHPVFIMVRLDATPYSSRVRRAVSGGTVMRAVRLRVVPRGCGYLRYASISPAVLPRRCQRKAWSVGGPGGVQVVPVMAPSRAAECECRLGNNQGSRRLKRKENEIENLAQSDQTRVDNGAAQNCVD